jgi:hypothetical protein
MIGFCKRRAPRRKVAFKMIKINKKLFLVGRPTKSWHFLRKIATLRTPWGWNAAFKMIEIDINKLFLVEDPLSRVIFHAKSRRYALRGVGTLNL